MGKKLMLLFAVMLLFFAVMGYNVDLILSDQLSEISTVEMSAMVASVSSVDADNGYVISVDDYNNIMHEEVRLAKVVGVGIQIILLILSIYLIYRNRTMLVTLLKRLFGR